LKDYTTASFIYGQLIYELGLKKLGATFEHFQLVVWAQVNNKYLNTDVQILINIRTFAPRVANWLPKSIQWYPFFNLGANTWP